MHGSHTVHTCRIRRGLLRALLFLVAYAAQADATACTENYCVLPCDFDGCTFSKDGAGALLRAGTCASTSGILRLDYKGIQLLLAGVFDGLTALTRLRLDKNALASLTVGVFDWLWAVTTLYLDYNALTNLPVGVFDGLSALTMLSLDCNLFASLSAGVLSGLTAVTTLHLYDNALTNLLVGGLTAVILFIQDLYSW